jgi:outer membrane protein assembly factor BamB
LHLNLNSQESSRVFLMRSANARTACVIVALLFKLSKLHSADAVPPEASAGKRTAADRQTVSKSNLLTPINAGFDWPCWRGPERNGISQETGWTWQWSSNGPAVLWRASVGKGFSSFAVVSNRVYTLGNADGTDTVFCFAADTGTVLWKHAYPCELQPLSYEGGPGATPAVDGRRVYTFSKGGDLFCLDAAEGRVIWSKQFEPWPRQEGDWANTWRYAGSPLVVHDKVFMSMGQAGAAFNKHDGTVIWQSPAGHPGYSSPVPSRGVTGDVMVFFSGRAVVGADRDTGKTLWSIPWKTPWDLNAADPITERSQLFVSSGNGVGCALFEMTTDPPHELWRNKNLKSTMNSAVLWQGHLYGFNDTHLSCLSWETGEELWSTRDVRKGSLIAAGGKLILLSETGKLVVTEPSPKGCQPLAQAQILEGRCWTTPVLSHGLLLARNAFGQVVCLDLRKRQVTQP